MYCTFRLMLLPIFILAGSASSFAATVTPNGDVYIDRGTGYQQVPGPIEAKAGDIVMAMAGGTATISYENGCMQTVSVGAVAVISEIPPCAGETTSTPPGEDYTLIIGGVAVAGGVAAAIALSGDDDPPASP